MVTSNATLENSGPGDEHSKGFIIDSADLVFDPDHRFPNCGSDGHCDIRCEVGSSRSVINVGALFRASGEADLAPLPHE